MNVNQHLAKFREKFAVSKTIKPDQDIQHNIGGKAVRKLQVSPLPNNNNGTIRIKMDIEPVDQDEFSQTNRNLIRKYINQYGKV